MAVEIGLLTCERLPQLSDDEVPLLDALSDLGYKPIPVIWNHDPWKDYDFLLFRNTWDYVGRYQQFQEFLNEIELAEKTVFNPLDLIRSNMNKSYLLDFHNQGLPVVPTQQVSVNEVKNDALKLRLNLNSELFVIKPSVSADSLSTFRGSLDSIQNTVKSIKLQKGVQWLLQPFLPSIEDEGEFSLIYFEGERSHCVVKKAKKGDFRVQDTFGGTAEVIEPEPGKWEVADRIIESLPSIPLYARVDLVNYHGEPMLLELELIEPSLFLTQVPRAASRFAKAIHGRIQKVGILRDR
ncbi:hypothetical protein HOF92_05800 [bacterium]|jgi:glutathione synthase/RimK-type ligase-like ATP-grasp enzyme|nr:hypothetical protein [bacterium]